MTDLRIERVSSGFIVMRGDDKKVAGPFTARAEAMLWVDSQKPKRP
jgi:hypothetical protein